MTEFPLLRERPRRRRSRGRRAFGLLLRLVLLAAVLAAGVALGEALHDNPKPGGARTEVRTLLPLPLQPERVTVTVTTGG